MVVIILYYAFYVFLHIKNLIQHPKQVTKHGIQKLLENLANVVEYLHKTRVNEIRHMTLHYYCKLMILPGVYDKNTKCILVRQSKWKAAVWGFLVLGMVELRILLLLAQPLMGNVSLKPIGSHSTIHRKEVDTILFYMGSPFVQLGLVCVNMILMGAKELLSISNAIVCVESRASVRYLNMDPAVGPFETFCKKYKALKFAHVLLSVFSIPAALAVRNVGMRHPESLMFLRSILCSTPHGPCGWFCLTCDSILTFYGAGLVIVVVGVVAHSCGVALSCLTFANTNSLKYSSKRKLYAELQVFMQYINIPLRPFLTVCQTLIFFGIIMINAAIPSVGRRSVSNGSTIMQTLVVLTSIIMTIMYYKMVTITELLYSESVELLKSLGKGGAQVGGYMKRKRGVRFQKLVERKRHIWLGRKPIALQMGALGTVENGHGIDFMQSVIQRTFDVVVLFR